MTASATAIAGNLTPTVSVTEGGTVDNPTYALAFGLPKNNIMFSTSQITGGYSLGSITIDGDSWNVTGGGGGKPTVSDFTAGTGIDITADLVNDTVEISVDNTVVPYKTDLATVATSGSYADLSNKPSIPTKTSDLTNDSGFIDNTVNDLTNYTLTSSLATVATSGSYNDLSNKPTIPDISHMVTDNTAQTISGAKTFTSDTVFHCDIETDIANRYNIGTSSKPFRKVFTQYIHGASGSDIEVTDLAVKSDIPDAVSGTNDGTNWTTLTIGSDTYAIPSGGSSSVDWSDITNKPTFATVATSGDYDDLIDKPDLSVYALSANLATVATSGSYNDLSNKPTIPVVDYPVTDVTVGGTSVVTNKVAAIPALFSGDYTDLTNKPDLSIYAESANLATVATSGSYNDLSNKPTIPTATSDLTNDSGFITGINSSDVTTALGFTPLANTACTYQTTAPTAAIADNGVHIVYLSSEPATKYAGYIYMIAEQ